MKIIIYCLLFLLLLLKNNPVMGNSWADYIQSAYFLLTGKEHYHDRSSGSHQWINYQPDFTELKQKVFGQHIAVDVVTSLVSVHLANDRPQRALLLSLHGYTGTGKSYLSTMLARALYPHYRAHQNSVFVHKLQSTHHLSKQGDAAAVTRFNDAIEKGLLSGGGRCLFILDEVDKYQEGFLDNLIPYLEADFIRINGNLYDSKKSIFILISNHGGEAINRVMIKRKANGFDRSSVRYWDFEELIDSSHLIGGGLNGTELATRGFIDRYIPFLPLEKEHIRLCTEEYLKSVRKFHQPQVNPGAEFIEKVVEEITFIPLETEAFSRFGCKRVRATVDTLLPK